MPSQTPMISVVIKVYNGQDTLAEALDSLVTQHCAGEWEILLSDNGSTDATRSVFAHYAKRFPDIPMRIVDASQRPGKSYALNVGIRAARADRLLFLDADDTVAPGWLDAMSRALAAAPLAAARIDHRPLNPEWIHAIRANCQEHRLDTWGHEPFCAYAGGATLGFHRRVFEAVGGFDETMTCLEDTDFCIRAHLKGFAIQFVPEAVYNYRYRLTPQGIRRQARDYARHKALLRRRYAKGERLFGLRAWLGLGVEFARLGVLALGSGGRAPLEPLEAARFGMRLGMAEGDLIGALAYRVAPPRRRFGGLRHRLNGMWRQALAGALRPFLGATMCVRTGEKRMALTFDDGPDPETTPLLLDLLARWNAKATFFVIGARAERHPDLMARIVAEGHEVGNHAWDHRSLPSLDAREIESQIDRTKALLAPHGQTLMRPPYGDQTFRVGWISRRLGYRTVLWSVAGDDWRDDDADAIADRILSQAAPGAIVLLHDSLYTCERPEYRNRAPTLKAVARVLARLPDYRFVTVSELLAAGAPCERVVVKTSPPAYLESLQPAAAASGQREQAGERRRAPDPPPPAAPARDPGRVAASGATSSLSKPLAKSKSKPPGLPAAAKSRAGR